MTPATEVTSDPNPAETAVQAQQARRKKRRMFALGLAVRLFGALLIWLGDGSPSLFRKAVVVVGVILSVGGIAVLRFMLISGFRKKK